jgi:histone deacetylase 1/2
MFGGPATLSVGRNKYYVSFIDFYSKFTWIYMIKRKSDVFQKFHDFQHHVERLFDKKSLVVQCDWGGEYHKLNTFFQRVGISHHISCPHAHQQNGSAECKHRHIVEVGLSLLAHALMPLKFWDEAFQTAVFLSIIFLVVLSTIKPPLSIFFKRRLIILSFIFLGVLVGLILPI